MNSSTWKEKPQLLFFPWQKKMMRASQPCLGCFNKIPLLFPEFPEPETNPGLEPWPPGFEAIECQEHDDPIVAPRTWGRRTGRALAWGGTIIRIGLPFAFLSYDLVRESAMRVQAWIQTDMDSWFQENIPEHYWSPSLYSAPGHKLEVPAAGPINVTHKRTHPSLVSTTLGSLPPSSIEKIDLD